MGYKDIVSLIEKYRGCCKFCNNPFWQLMADFPGLQKFPLTNLPPSIRITFKLKNPLAMLVADAGLGCEEE